MPISSRVDRKRRRIEVTVSGDFTTDDLESLVSRTVADPDFQPGFDVLSDHTEVGEPLTPEQSRYFLALIAGLGSTFAGIRWAVVATKPASYGMLRMMSAMVQRIPIAMELFATRPEAEAWLARPRDAAPAAD